MKYRKHEAKEYARSVLKGVWTALPYHFTLEDKLDETAIAASLEHCISELKIEGHYCSGNVAEFWAMTNAERMRAHEINAETAKGRIPLIAGCHHQNPYEVVTLATHAEAVGMPGGPVRAPCTELPEEKKNELRADLAATGILTRAKANAGAAASPKQQAA